jgi:hypothetical protein
MWSVTGGGPGLVAVGWDGLFADRDAAVWTSTDGITWSRVAHDAAVFGAADSQVMLSVTGGGPGLVAVGGELVAVGGDLSGGDADAAVWVAATED